MQTPLFVMAMLILTLGRPASRESVQQCHLPKLPSGRPFKVMTYNMQMALGEYREFWKNETPPMPDNSSVQSTLSAILEMIDREDADIVVLQEVARENDVSHYVDQVIRIRQHFLHKYCTATTSYWYAPYILHGQMNGPMNYNLMVLSKYRMTYQQEHILPGNVPLLSGYIYPERKLFEVSIALRDGGEMLVASTHLDAHDKGGLVRKQQLAFVFNRLKELSRTNVPFVVGGDFNLLPGRVFHLLPDNQKQDKPKEVNMGVFYRHHHFGVVPPESRLTATSYFQWTTAYDRNMHSLDIMLDYLIHSRPSVVRLESSVKQQYYELSDHVPVVATYRLSRDRKNFTLSR